MKKIFITGAFGLLGSALTNQLYGKYSIYRPTHKELNLLDKNAVKSYIGNNGPFHCVFHLAAQVGGVKANTEYVADFFNKTMQMNLNVFEACKHQKTDKLVSILSTCIYPDTKYITLPLKEKDLHLGPPHQSNFGYAYAKRMLEVQSRAYRQQHGLNGICAIPNNLFGESDNYDLENGHVVPSLIRKIFEAKKNNLPNVEIWGTGKPLREFTYTKDAAKILEVLMEEYNDEEPVNIGNTNEYSISELATSIKTAIGYTGELIYNTSKPEGQFRKNSINSRLLETTSWKNNQYTSFDVAIKNSCDWFASQYPNVRGI